MTKDAASAAIDAMLAYGCEYGFEQKRHTADALEALAQISGRSKEDAIRVEIHSLREIADNEERMEADRRRREANPRTAEQMLSDVENGSREPFDVIREREIWDAIPEERRMQARFEGAVRKGLARRMNPNPSQWTELPGGLTQASAFSLLNFRNAVAERMRMTTPSHAMTGGSLFARQDHVRQAFQRAAAETKEFAVRVDAEVERRIKEAQP